MITFLIFLAVISVLVFVHEFGHFISAKKSGMRVDEFAFGFPPRLWGITKGETTYSINWIPFGGFVKIHGEDGGDHNEPRSFASKPFRHRMLVILAGVLMNFAFAAVLLMFGNFMGLRIGLIDETGITGARDVQVQVISVGAGTPAETAGLQPFDQIKGFKTPDGTFTATGTPAEVQSFVNAHAGEKITIVVGRGGADIFQEAELRKDPPAGQGPLGISLALTGTVSYPWYEAIWRGVRDAGVLAINTVFGYVYLFKTLFTEGKLVADVSGPIGIARLTGQAAQFGFTYLVQFVAMISVNLAVLNVMPFPALDGGRAVLLIAEKVKGRPLNRKTEGAINAVGFMVLIALMVLITVKDISRLF